MSRQNQILALVFLVMVLGVTAYFFVYRVYFPSSDSVRVNAGTEAFVPVNVDNPALRLDVLQHFLKLEYKGLRRNIFTASLPPPPKPVSTTPVNTAPLLPSGPAPLTVDAKYFGFVSDSTGNHRRAFFSSGNNEDVFIAGEGDTLLGRFRVVRITNTTADVEEVSSGRRATLTLEQPGPTG
jgi:hypothetical protein